MFAIAHEAKRCSSVSCTSSSVHAPGSTACPVVHRSAIAGAIRDGISVQEVEHITDSISQEMKHIDKQWAQAKGQHAGQIWFINRLPVLQDEPGVRKFTARDNTGAMLAYIFFDPVYEAGVLVGYYANVTRMVPDAHPGCLNLIMRHVIGVLRTEAGMEQSGRQKGVKKAKAQKGGLQACEAGQITADGVSLVQVGSGHSQTEKRNITVSCSVTKAGSNVADTSGKGLLRSIMDTEQQRDQTVSAAKSRAGAADVMAELQSAGSNAINTSQSKTGVAGRSGSHVRFVSLGLSPFHHMDDDTFKQDRTVRVWMQHAYEHGSCFYPFKSVALSKAKYGAGLDNGVYRDPNVTWQPVYLAQNLPSTAAVMLFDLGVLMKFWKGPIDALQLVLSHEMAQLKARRRAKKASSKNSNTKLQPAATAQVDGSSKPGSHMVRAETGSSSLFTLGSAASELSVMSGADSTQ